VLSYSTSKTTTSVSGAGGELNLYRIAYIHNKAEDFDEWGWWYFINYYREDLD